MQANCSSAQGEFLIFIVAGNAPTPAEPQTMPQKFQSQPEETQPLLPVAPVEQSEGMLQNASALVDGQIVSNEEIMVLLTTM